MKEKKQNCCFIRKATQSKNLLRSKRKNQVFISDQKHI